MKTEQNTRLGIYLMIATTMVFAVQDGISRHLVANYNVYMVVMIRFWVFAAFVIAIAARSPGGLRAAVRSHRPYVQIFRGVLLVFEVCVMVVAFVKLGLIESHAVFTCYPLLVAAMSGPLLGERVGWRRWTAIAVGFLGMMIILRPGFSVFSPMALLPLLSAFMFALYSLLTRLVAGRDSAAVSFFWTGVSGAVAVTPFGITHFQMMQSVDWIWMAGLCVTALIGHWLLIRAYSVAEASAIQPFAYLQLVFVSLIGLFLLGETLQVNLVVGGAIVVGAGIFTLWRQGQAAKASPP